ncbi:hypothetical protein ASE07_26760 [Noviherbaspirillum sp. Root189]|nr:hypothetical protein ASE07_26760 [Noviherbaspirillum sp. Root189]
MLLSKTQKRVMALVGQGRPVEDGAEQGITMNGVHLCNHETMVVLRQWGLIVRDENGRWSATESGKAIAQQLRL